MSKLLTIQGIGPGELELLDAAGWGDLRALAGADPAKLAMELAKANSMLRIVGKLPDQNTVAGWVQDAKDISNGVPVRSAASAKEIPTKRGAAAARPKAAADPTPAKPARRRGKAKAASAVQEELLPPMPAEVVEEIPIAEETVEVEPQAYDEEAAIARVSGPVNYEADPEVQEMLLRAPVAIPIPARMLAEKGIGPSEIAVAPLLNRALGDLEVRVAAAEEPEPEKKKAEIPGSNRESSKGRPAVTVSSIAPSTPVSTPATAPLTDGSNLTSTAGANSGSRRGIDTARVRTVEEFQGDTPVAKSSSSRAGMEDSRIALLRAPLPGTNGRRKPSSRFYIRGVLHDRPLKVWFGGLFAVLLQITLPLAILAAPLLILVDQQVKHFGWVPSWIIAFPIALPVLALLYAIVSTGAKCRVCGQRIYMPKNCLKNRKAHNAFYFGHIGALAFHVMIFKWFNCTFCGTPIRIKK